MTLNKIFKHSICLVFLVTLNACKGEAQNTATVIEQTNATLVNKDNTLLDNSVNNAAEAAAIQSTVPMETAKQKHQQDLGLGHKEIRRLLGGDIGQMQFDTQAANTFRVFMANTLLSSGSNNSEKNPGGRSYTSGKNQIQFCANGTYVEAIYSEVIINTEGTGGSSSGTTYIPGYWEVAALPNGQFIILMYSQHPNVLEDFPNGFQPWVVPKYGEDFVSAPNGDLYSRITNQYCN